MNLEELRDDIIEEQKKGLPFICASVVIWLLITIVASLKINIETKNILVFVCSSPMVLIAWLAGKKLGTDIFKSNNPLSQLAMLFTANQMLYIIIVAWIFNAMPEKMIMVYAMVFGAHLLPYSWLYKSNAYKIFAIIIPIISLVLGIMFNGFIVSLTVTVLEVIFVLALFNEMKTVNKK